MTAIFILEFGVIFHSVFIGLTLAVAGENFNVLYIVLSFHQTFEGLGLGSRLATAEWPRSKRWMPWVLGSAYGVTTPIAIAIGLGVQTSFAPGSQKTMIVNGVFDSISAGILIYTGLVELMAHEFMFNPEMRKSSIKMMMFAFLCMCLGAGLMALLGKWA
jgi:zinc transporter 1/2/3